MERIQQNDFETCFLYLRVTVPLIFILLNKILALHFGENAASAFKLIHKPLQIHICNEMRLSDWSQL